MGSLAYKPKEENTIDLNEVENTITECKESIKDLSIHIMRMRYNINVQSQQHIQ